MREKIRKRTKNERRLKKKDEKKKTEIKIRCYHVERKKETKKGRNKLTNKLVLYGQKHRKKKKRKNEEKKERRLYKEKKLKG